MRQVIARHKLFATLSLCLLLAPGIARATGGSSVPPECRVIELGEFPFSALRNGLFSLRMQFTQIAVVIRANSQGDLKVARKIEALARQSDKALQQALRAVESFPDTIVSCPDESVCTQRLLDEERQRIIFAAIKLSDVSVRLVNKFPDLLGQDPIFVIEAIQSRLNAFFDGIDFLPPFTYDCPKSKSCRRMHPS